MLADWYRLVVERAVPVGRADGRKARRWRASSSPARTGRRRHGPPRPTSRASCARAARRTRCPRSPLPEGDPLHLPALLAAAFGLSTSEARRMIGQGGVKLNGTVVSRARPAARRARGIARAGGQAAVRALRERLTLRIHTVGPDPATIDRPPAREAAESPLSLDTGAALERIGYDLYRIICGPLARVGRGLFVARLDRHRSLKTQQRT